MNSKGEVIDENGRKIGEIGPGGILVDKHGDPIPGPLPNPVAYVGGDGIVIGSDGEIIGMATPDGNVVDING